MTVSVLVHGALLPEAPKLVWWAESPDVRGFSATADTLVELRELTAQTLRDIWEDRGDDPEMIEIRWEMLPEPETEGAPVSQEGEAKTTGPSVVERVLAAAAA